MIRRRVSTLAIAAAVALSTACTLLVDTSGLAGDPVDADVDAAAESSVAVDGSIAETGGGDAGGSDAAAPPCPVHETGLLAYYRFDETSGVIAADCSGNGHDGIVTNPTWMPGDGGGALAFDGLSTCVTMGSSTDLIPAGAFTISALIEVHVYTISDPDAGMNRGRYLVSKAKQIPETSGWRIATDANGLVNFKLGTDAGVASVMTNNQPIDTWLHVAIVFDPGARLELWVEGVLIGSDASPPLAYADDATPVHIGCLQSSNFFDGLVDEVRLYDRALSFTEIANLAR